MELLEGAATIVGLADGRLFAFRDSLGFRPLVLGRLGDDPVRRLRDVRARPDRRDVRARDPARRARPRRRGRPAVDPGARARRARRALHLRVLLPRAARHAARPASRCTARACAWASGSPRRRRSRPTSCCRSPTRARPPRSASRAPRHPVQRGPDQEPLRRPHVHPARPGHARPGRAHEVQPARRGEREAARRRRRLDRARLDHAADRADAVRLGRRRGARARLVAADRLAVLLRHRPRDRGRDDRRARDGRRGARRDRRDVARLPLARRAAGGDAPARSRRSAARA